MPSANVNWPLPLTRLNPWFPGQMGVPGTDTETGLRQHSTGCIFYVDPNYPGASDARDGTNPEDPLLTIQAAIDKCQPYRGDVVAVMANNAWHYHNTNDGVLLGPTGPVVISTPGIRLVGVSPSSTLGVVWQPTADNQTLVTINAVDVTIEGFNFYAGLYTGVRAVLAEWGALKFGDNATIRHCNFEGVVIGIQLEYAWYCDIHDNVFRCSKGIYVDTAGNGSAYNEIHDNNFDYCAQAIQGEDMDYSFIHRNSIYNFLAATAQAGATNAGVNLTGGLHNQVFDNWFSCALPGPANGDWDDFNSPGTGDAWVGNHCMNGLAITNPT